MPGKSAKQIPPLKPTIPFSDFLKLDLRIGKVVTASRVEKSERLIRMDIDFGKAVGYRTIYAGIALWYKPEDLLGKKFIFVPNLEPKPMMGGESQGMMLALDDGEKAVLIPIDDAMSAGSIVR